MRSPAGAIAWELRRRHRWGLAAVVLYLAVLAALRLLVLAPGGRIAVGDDWSFAVVVVVPLSSTFAYLLGVFSFGFAGDVAARQSMYPERMFTLPVTNAALAGWPMLYGSAAMAVLWLVTRALAVWPSGADVPVLWPALFAAVFLGWSQALVWMPYPLSGLRVIASVVWLAVIGFVVLLALELDAPEPMMLVLLVPQVPLAYLTARLAVARARRGQLRDGRRIVARLERALERMGELLARRKDGFRTPVRAQVWLEWRRHGRSLPAIVAMLLPVELALLYAFRDAPVLLVETLLGVLLTPPFLASFVAATASRSMSMGTDAHELPPFLATRPLPSTSLVAAKLEATIRSALATWLLVLAALPVALGLSGTGSVVVEGARRIVEVVGAPRAVAFGLLGLTFLVAFTWKQLVQGLYIGMSGRVWLVRGSVFATLSLLTLLVALLQWALGDRRVLVELWCALPWILAVLVCAKMTAAAWIVSRLHGSGMLSDHTLVLGALGWSGTVLALHGLLVWLLPTLLLPSYLLALVAILSVPLARLAAAPLALAWNRHR